jgi:hypothetical protein
VGGNVRAGIELGLVEAGARRGICKQLLSSMHKFIDAIELSAPLLQFFGFLFGIARTQGNGLVAANEMSLSKMKSTRSNRRN